MSDLDTALRFTFEKLTREELIELAIVLTKERLHSAGRKSKKKEET